MTVIHTTNPEQFQVEVVRKHFVNVYELLVDYRERLVDMSKGGIQIPFASDRIWRETPECLKYHDLCIGVLNTGDVFIGESCPAKIEDYKREMAHELSERAMMNQVYAARSFLIKNERSKNRLDGEKIPEVPSSINFKLPVDTEVFNIPLNHVIQLGAFVPQVNIAVLVLPNDYAVVDYAQGQIEVYQYQYADLSAVASIRAFLKVTGLINHLSLVNRAINK